MKQWTERDATARSGIVKLDRVVTDMGYIWRPTPNSNVGIDGEIELVEDRAATAKIIKVQVKSGPSYFRKEDQRSFELHTSIDDVKYWLSLHLHWTRYGDIVRLRKSNEHVSAPPSVARIQNRPATTIDSVSEHEQTLTSIGRFPPEFSFLLSALPA